MSGKTMNKDINALKAIAIILVVFGHSADYARQYAPVILGETTFLNIVFSIHVPLFFMVAGYLVRRQAVLPFYWKKVRFILVPFLFFSTVSFLYAILFAPQYMHGPTIPIYARSVYLYGSHYWFAYAILAMFALCPLLWREEKSFRWVTAAVFAIMLILNTVSSVHPFLPKPELFQGRNIIKYSPWFFLGLLSGKLPKRGKYFDRAAAGASALIIAAMTVALYKGRITFNYWPKFILSVAFGYLLQYLVSFIPENRFLEWTARYSLQLFFLDSAYRMLFYKLLTRFLPVNDGMVLLTTALNLGLGILTCRIAERIPVIRELFGLGKEKRA